MFLFYNSGMTTPVLNFFPKEFLPVTPSFVTYEGSLTRPGCMETVTWVILNKPIHVSHSQVSNAYLYIYFSYNFWGEKTSSLQMISKRVSVSSVRLIRSNTLIILNTSHLNKYNLEIPITIHLRKCKIALVIWENKVWDRREDFVWSWWISIMQLFCRWNNTKGYN